LVSHIFPAIFAQNLGPQAKRAIFQTRLGGDRGMAISLQPFQKGTFCHDAGKSLGMVDWGEQRMNWGIGA
jgi:hypothetical protein